MRTVIDKPGAARLLESGVGMSPEDFNRAVQQFRLALEHGEDTAARQHASRSLRFSNGPDGMIRLTGLLPALEGGTLETILGAISEAKYRRDNPVRALSSADTTATVAISASPTRSSNWPASPHQPASKRRTPTTTMTNPRRLPTTSRPMQTTIPPHWGQHGDHRYE